MKLPFSSKYVSLLATAAVLIALHTVGCVSFANFGSLRVGVNLIGDNAFLGVAAIGATFVILSGGIDLSVGAAVAFTSLYLYSGFCSALAGVVYTFYTQSGDPASCVGLELDAIAALVIGGTLLSGGVGFMAGTAMGVLILGLIQTLITFQGNLNTWWTRIVVGMLVLVFILLQNVISTASRRLGEAQRR